RMLNRSASVMASIGAADEARTRLTEAHRLAVSCGDVRAELRASELLAILDADGGAFVAAERGCRWVEGRYRARGRPGPGRERAVRLVRGGIALERLRLDEAGALLAEDGVPASPEVATLCAAGLGVGHLLAGDPAAAREALASLRPTVRTLRGWFYATGYRAV